MLATQDQTSPLLNIIYDQVTRSAAGYNDNDFVSYELPDARGRSAEAETTGWSVSKLRADPTAAADHIRNLQERLDRQTPLALDKDHVIQSIAEESQAAHDRLKKELR